MINYSKLVQFTERGTRNWCKDGLIIQTNWPNPRLLCGTLIQRYQSSQVSKGEHSSHMNIEERAPSTAEEFKRVAEEKLKKAEQGVASQTADKTCDATEETTLGDSSVDSVKNRFKQHEPGAADYRRRSHDD